MRFIWVDPARDFALTRYLISRNGRILVKIDVSYPASSTSEWLPNRWELVSYESDGSLRESTRASVTLFEVNSPSDPRDYQIQIPNGSVVLEESPSKGRGVYQIDDGGRKSPVLPPRTSADRSPLSSGSSGGILATTPYVAGAVAAVSALWLLWKLRRRWHSTSTPFVHDQFK